MNVITDIIRFLQCHVPPVPRNRYEVLVVDSEENYSEGEKKNVNVKKPTVLSDRDSDTVVDCDQLLTHCRLLLDVATIDGDSCGTKTVPVLRVQS